MRYCNPEHKVQGSTACIQTNMQQEKVIVSSTAQYLQVALRYYCTATSSFLKHGGVFVDGCALKVKRRRRIPKGGGLSLGLANTHLPLIIVVDSLTDCTALSREPHRNYCSAPSNALSCRYTGAHPVTYGDLPACCLYFYSTSNPPILNLGCNLVELRLLTAESSFALRLLFVCYDSIWNLVGMGSTRQPLHTRPSV